MAYLDSQQVVAPFQKRPAGFCAVRSGLPIRLGTRRQESMNNKAPGTLVPVCGCCTCARACACACVPCVPVCLCPARNRGSGLLDGWGRAVRSHQFCLSSRPLVSSILPSLPFFFTRSGLADNEWITCRVQVCLARAGWASSSGATELAPLPPLSFLLQDDIYPPRVASQDVRCDAHHDCSRRPNRQLSAEPAPGTSLLLCKVALIIRKSPRHRVSL